MITYKNCTEVKFEKIYEAFLIGFSDYMIKFQMSEEVFSKHFFEIEGNKLEYSFIALDNEKPIGLILGGIKNYEGVKTIRCGALCVNPEYRGIGVSKKLFELHKKVALDNKCKQMFLEVITQNYRAIKFYRNYGYDNIYNLRYYSCKDTEIIKREIDNNVDIKNINFKEITNLSSMMDNIHINWQNDFDYIKRLGNLIHYGAYENSKLRGVLSINSNGKIFFIWTNSDYRHRGIAKNLIINAVNELKLDKLSISFPNNADIEGFLKHIKFEKDEISQYEMYLTI
jgi:ribosomal protein S18 acetylase RimI-like enzyme